MLIQIGLIGFLIVIGLSALSVKPEKSQEDEDANGDAPSTPKRGRTPRESEKLGTIATPAGRRSARIARTRKED